MGELQPRTTRYFRRKFKAAVQEEINRIQRKSDAAQISAAGDSEKRDAVSPQSLLPMAVAEGDIEHTGEGGRGKKMALSALTDEQLETFAENYQLVRLIKDGLSAKKAIAQLGIDRKPRTALNLVKRFEEQGVAGLVDGRWGRGSEVRVLTCEVKKITLGWFFARKAAGPRAIAKEVAKACRERGLLEPSESSIKNYLAGLDEVFVLFRQGKLGLEKFRRSAFPVTRFENTTYANERWQGDHAPLDIWVRLKVNGEWKPYRVYITVLLDAHTRAVPGYVVSTHYPNSYTIALTFRRAILPKVGGKTKVCGIPTIFQSDCGKDFLCAAVAATLAGLHVTPDPDHPYYPNEKGKVERFFKTLDTGCLRILPGHFEDVGRTETAAQKRVHELPTLQSLDAKIARWLDEEYHVRKHSETGRSPEEFWLETVQLNLPDSEEELDLLLLKYDREITVVNTGLRFTLNGVKHRYWAPELAPLYKRRVRIRYNPDLLESVLVYDAATAEYICEAWNMDSDEPHYTIADVKSARKHLVRGLIERTKYYMQSVYANDRNAAEKAEREEELRLAEAQAAEEREFVAAEVGEDNYAEVEELIALFKQKDGGA